MTEEILLAPQSGELVTVSAEENAVVAYLFSLGEGSRRTMLGSLNVIAGLMTSGRLTALEYDWSQLELKHTKAIRAALAEKYSPATVNKMLCAVRGVMGAAWDDKQMDSEQYHRARSVKAISGEVLPAGRALTKGELIALFQACPDTVCGVRDRALLMIAYGAGLRRSEIVNLDLSDYNSESGEFRIRQGKGRKDRMVQTNKFLRAPIAAWLQLRGPEPGPLLYPTPKGGGIERRRLDEQTIYTSLKRCQNRAKVADFSPHDLRRSFGTHLFEAGADAAMVQALMGHSHIATTLRYDRRGEAHKQAAVDLLHLPI